MSNNVDPNRSTGTGLSDLARAARSRAGNILRRENRRIGVIAPEAIHSGGAAGAPPAQPARPLPAAPIAPEIAALHAAQDDAENFITFCGNLPFCLHIPRFQGTPIQHANAIIEWMSPGENGHPDGAGHARVLGCTQLHFRNARIGYLPKEIRLFRNLRTLDLSFCDLEELPPEIGHLLALERLNLCGNLPLRTLPAEIGQLIALSELNVENVPLTTLPDEMIGLVSLELLNLRGVQLPTLPNALFNLPTQCTVTMSINQFRPDYLEQFRQRFLANQAQNPDQGPFINGLFPAPANAIAEQAPAPPNAIAEQVPAPANAIAEQAAPPVRNRPRERRRGIYVPPDPVRIAQILRQIPEEEHDPIRTLPEELQSWSQEFEAAFPPNAENEALWKDRMTDFSSLVTPSAQEMNEHQVNEREISYLDKLDYFNVLLQKLRLTKGYTTPATKNHFLLRVEHMIQSACSNPAFKKQMLKISEDGGTSCGDRALLTLNDIEIAYQFHSKDLTDEEFRSLAIRASRYQLLTKHGQEIHEKNGGDEISIILALHTRHREALDLPIPEQEMLYERSAGLTEPMYREALELIQKYTDPQLLELSEVWQNRIYERQKQASDALTEKYNDLVNHAEEYYDIPKEKQTEREAWLISHPDLKTIIVKDGEVVIPDYGTATKAIMAARETAKSHLGDVDQKDPK